MRTVRGRAAAVIALCTVLLVFVVWPSVVTVKGADHREAPLISEDNPADIGDVFAFLNPNDPTKVVLALGVNGFSVPAVRGGYAFSPDVLYQFKIDNTGDGREDVVIQVTFEGFESARDPRCPAAPNGQGGQFLSVRGPAAPRNTGIENRVLARQPSVGGCTNLVLEGTHGVRAFAGLRDDSFVVDAGQLFRILGGTQEVFREFASPVLGPLRGRPVRPDGTSGSDAFGGFNASMLVVEVPVTALQGTASRNLTYLENNSTIGVWGTTSRQRLRRLSDEAPADSGPFVQIQRNGHQFFKSVFLFPTTLRDQFNRSLPENDEAFASLIPDALTVFDNDGTGNTIAGRAAVLDAVGVTSLPTGAPLLLPPDFVNRNPDLLRKVLLPDVLRLNLALTADDLGVGSNGLQNGRRPGDDVIDILFRLTRQLADIKFPDGSGLPGSGPAGFRNALNCSTLPCPDRRIFAVLQGTDFIEPDAAVADLATSGLDRPLVAAFPFFGTAHPFPGAAGTTGYPPQE